MKLYTLLPKYLIKKSKPTQYNLEVGIEMESRKITNIYQFSSYDFFQYGSFKNVKVHCKNMHCCQTNSFKATNLHSSI